MNDTPVPRKFQMKGFTSLLLAFSFMVLVFSGVILYFTPQGMIAHWSNWTLFGLGKEQWADIHICDSLLFLIATILHLYLNWRIFWSYIKKKAAGLNLKRELAAALVVTVVVVAGTHFSVPPLSNIIDWNSQIKRYWAQRSSRPPVPHAERLSIQRFAFFVGLPADEIADALRKESFTFDDNSITLGELAEQKHIAPSELFAAIARHLPELSKAGGKGAGRGKGRGQSRGGGQGMGMGRGVGVGMGQGPGSGQGKGRGGGQQPND